MILAALSFPGGDLGRLAQSLAEWRPGPAVALIQAVPERPHVESRLPYAPKRSTRSIEGFKGTDDPRTEPVVEYLRREARVGSGFGEGYAAIWDLAWQPSTTRFEGTALSLPLPRDWSPAAGMKGAEVTVAGGRVSASLPRRGAVRLRDLPSVGWSRPLKVHWLLREMWLVPVARNAPEAAFLRAAAAAVGGRLVVVTDAYRIDLDPKAFRERAQAAVEAFAPKPTDRFAVAGRAVAREAWRAIDDATVERLFSRPALALSRPVSGDAALSAALAEYLRAYREETASMPEGAAPRALLGRLASGAPRIVYGQNLGAGGGWPRVGGGTIVL